MRIASCFLGRDIGSCGSNGVERLLFQLLLPIVVDFKLNLYVVVRTRAAATRR